MSHGKIGSGVLAGQIEEGSTLLIFGRNPEVQQKWKLGAGLLAILLASTTAGMAQNAPQKPEQPAVSPSAATPAQLPAPPAGAGVDAARYIIGAEDTLQITVWKEPTLSGTIPVRPDGRISLVLVGDLPAAGRTPMQLSDDITVKLKKYIQDPNVSVVVMSVNSQKIFLVGEVGHVGPVMMTAGMSPLQAIAAGGGLTPYANAKKIYILRSEGGKQEKIPFNYKQALKGEAQGPELKPGDTIVVP
jgi:polysaccharide export outer membrane protein